MLNPIRRPIVFCVADLQVPDFSTGGRGRLDHQVPLSLLGDPNRRPGRTAEFQPTTALSFRDVFFVVALKW